MMIYELDDIERRALLSDALQRARADLNDGRPLTEMRQPIPETRIRRDRDGWVIEARMPQGVNVYRWVIKGWTSGTKRDAQRSEREIRAEMEKG